MAKLSVIAADSLKGVKELKTAPEHFEPVLEKRRWFMLFIFGTVILSSSFQWLHINIVSNSAKYFWNGSLPGKLKFLNKNSHFVSYLYVFQCSFVEDPLEKDSAIVWLSIVYMIVYIPLIFPATWIFNRFGLRVTILLGAGLNTLGALIKCVSCELSQPYGVNTISAKASFPVLMLGQFISSVAQDFILSMPTQVAVTWFGENELTMATSIGVFGNQVWF